MFASSLKDRIHACVLMRREPIGVTVQVRYDEAPLAILVHEGARDAAVRLIMSRSKGEVLIRAHSCRFASADYDLAASLAAAIQSKLQEISRRPLSGRQVEAILQISGQERRQWTREGLLPTVGQSRIIAGARVMTLRTYSAAAIEELMSDRGTIDTWRSSGSAIAP